MSTAKCKIKNTIAVILLLTFSLILLLLFLTSNFSQAYAVTSYDSIVSTLTSDGYKTTESLGDSDLLDPSQKNYKGHNNTNDFIVASTKWTDKKAGKAEIKLQAAAYETPEQDFTDPVYIFTECSYRGYTFNHAVNHIKNIVELFGSCRVIAIMDSSYRKGNYLETSTDDTTIRNNLQPYNAWRSGNHPNYLIYSGLKEYLFGSISTPATKENAKAYPAAIFVNISDLDDSRDNSNYATAAADANFWHYLRDTYVDKWDRYYCITDGNLTFSDYYSDDQNKVYRALVSPEFYDAPGSHRADYSDSDTFASYGINKPPDLLVETDVANIFSIDSTSATCGSTPVEAKSEGQKIQGYINEYTYGDLLTLTANVTLKNNADLSTVDDWFNVSTSSSLFKLSNLINTVDATKLSLTPEMSIAKTVSQTSAQPTDIVQYDIKITNEGPGNAKNIQVSDTLPDKLTFDGTPTATTGAPSISGSKLSLSIDRMTRDDSVTITYKAKVNANASGGTITNTAHVTATAASEKTATADLKILVPELGITKTVSQETAQADDVLTYAIQISNIGDAASVARNVTVNDILPDMLTPVGKPAATSGSTNIMGQVLNGTIGNINAGKTVTVSFQAQVKKEAIGTITNTATTEGNNLSVKQSSASTDILLPELTLTKIADEDIAQPNDFINYTIALSNSGQGRAKDFVITDNIPSQLILTEPPTTDIGIINIDGNMLTVTGDSLEAGATATVSVKAQIDDFIEPGNYLNIATAKAIHVDTLTSSDDFTIIPAKLTIDKTPNVEYAQVGDKITYSINVANIAENSTAKRVIIADTIPPELTIAGEPTIQKKNASGEEVPINPDEQIEQENPGDINDTNESDIPGNQDNPEDENNQDDPTESDTPNTDNQEDKEILENKNIPSNTEGIFYDTVVLPTLFAESNIQNGDESILPKKTADDNTPQEENGNIPNDNGFSDGSENEEEQDNKDTPVTSGDELETEKNDNNQEENDNSEDNGQELPKIIYKISGDEKEYTGEEEISVYKDINGIWHLSPDCFELLATLIEGEEIPTPELMKIKDIYSQCYEQKEMDHTFLPCTECCVIEKIISNSVIDGNEVIMPDNIQTGEIGEIIVNQDIMAVAVGDLAYGDQITITYEAIVNEGVVEDINSSAYAHVDYIPNVTDDAPIEILTPILTIDKTATSENVIGENVYGQVGSNIIYTVEVNQTTERAVARNVVITDKIPEQLSVDEISGTEDIQDAQTTIQGNEITVTIPEVNYEQPVIINIETTVDEYVEEPIVNTAEVIADYMESVSDDATIMLSALSILKTASVEETTVREPYEYDIAVINESKSATAFDLVVKDDVPEGLYIQDVPSIDGTEGEIVVDGQKIIANVTQLDAGESFHIQFTVSPELILAEQTIPNVATVSSAGLNTMESGANVKINAFSAPAADIVIPSKEILPRLGEFLAIHFAFMCLIAIGIGSMYIIIRKHKSNKK